MTSDNWEESSLEWAIECWLTSADNTEDRVRSGMDQ